jgi:glycyl-tRNA synthetase beta chain
VEDDALAREVAGLVEWPVVLMGAFEESFLNIPPEVIQTTIRANQKCFVVKNNNKLTNRFIITSNLEASDGGAAIIAGNERVIRARLSDAKFFFETDKAKPLASRLEKFKTITYHEKIGTQYARIERIQQLALEINAKTFNLDNALVRQAATLCKADLVTEMVGEFPELQGLMGRYYAEHEGLNTQVSQAIEQHYKPVGANDTLPEEPLSRIIALADKLDQLIQFWTINEKPTGSKDPFALRRAALGIIRILQETGSSLDIAPLIPEGIRNDLMGFVKDRLKQQLIDNGQRHDVVEAVFALPLTLHELTTRVEALKNFITTQEGAKFINNFNRANNILKAEEKKGAIAFLAHIQEQDCTRNEEKDVLMNLNLLTQIYNNSGNNKLQFFTDAGLINESLEAFFTNLLVNSDDPKERIVRLSLLNEFRKLCLQLGDLSKIL